jgi:hypothetical protein
VKKLTEVEAALLKHAAMEQMTERRAGTGKAINRSIRRSWEYGEGKKTAVKVGGSLAIAGIFGAVGAATHGVGLPIVIGLAAGGLVVGKLSDTAFAKVWGRQYIGGGRTREWVQEFQAPSDMGEAKLLEERAHKTIRRAYQHYRTGFAKAEALPAGAILTSCDQCVAALVKALGAKHHLDKARLYLHPALFLAEALMIAHYGRWNDFKDHEEVVCNAEWHSNHRCEGKCFMTLSKTFPPALVKEHLWTQGDIERQARKLEDARRTIETDPTIQGSGPSQGYNKEIRWLYEDAMAIYGNRQLAKLKHGVTNMWDRKTKGEQKAFAAKQGASIGLAALGGGIHGHYDEVLDGAAILLDAGLTALDTSSAEGIESLDRGPTRPTNLAKHKDGSQIASESQEAMRKAAIHLFEINTICGEVEKANGNRIGDCEGALDYLSEIFRIQHHLSKTEHYLTETIHTVTELTELVTARLERLTVYHTDLNRSIRTFLATGNHNGCTGGSCYKRRSAYAMTS